MILNTFKPNPFPMYYNMCDHINGNRSDNRLENLRWSNVNLNGINKKNVKGYWIDWRLRKKFCTSVKVQGKQCHLGSYGSIAEAQKAYKEGADRAFEILEI